MLPWQGMLGRELPITHRSGDRLVVRVLAITGGFVTLGLDDPRGNFRFDMRASSAPQPGGVITGGEPPHDWP